MDEYLEHETDNLIRSWDHYDRNFLAEYLVSDVQDPRINIQSILSRHFLLEKLFGDAPGYLMDHEIRFSLAVNWVMELVRSGSDHQQLLDLQDSLFNGQSSCYGLKIPDHVSETFAMLSIPNYMCSLLSARPPENDKHFIEDCILSTFEHIWSEELKERNAKRISVIEPACGSANDWRFINRFGISRFVNYTGFDLCRDNIYNGRAMFNEIDFRVGNVLQIDCEDNSYDYCYLHDLLEHLSIKAMEVAIAEICRVTKEKLCIHFFNMSDIDENVVERSGDYHWNTLSCQRTRAVFLEHASIVEAVCIDKFLKEKFNYPDTHNKNAYTFYVTI